MCIITLGSAVSTTLIINLISNNDGAYDWTGRSKTFLLKTSIKLNESLSVRVGRVRRTDLVASVGPKERIGLC